MRVALYTRVSTEEQLEGYSLDAQLRACRSYCADRGWQIVREYAEEGRSARTEDIRKRPAFRQMLADVAAHACDVVMVHKLDRFSRNLRITLESFEALSRASTAFVSVTEQIDYTTPTGKLFLHMLAALAQWYSDNLAQETKKGKAERKAQGLYNGLLPFGYAKGEDRVPVPDRRELESGGTNLAGLLLAFELAAAGRSDAEVAGALNGKGYRTTGNRGRGLFTKDTVRRILVNRFYLGELPDGRGGWIRGKHEPIVSVDLFERAQAARAENRTTMPCRAVPASRQTYSLTGLLRCGHCADAGREGRIHLNLVHGVVRARCYGRSQGLGCPQRGFALAVYERQIEEWLAQIEVARDLVEQALVDGRRPERTENDPGAERRRLETRLERLRDMYGWGDITQAEYQAERDAILVRLRELQPVPVRRIDRAAIAALLTSPVRIWRLGSQAERNELVRQLVERVIVRDDQVERIVPRAEMQQWVPEWTPIVASSGSDGIRTRDLSLDRAAC